MLFCNLCFDLLAGCLVGNGMTHTLGSVLGVWVCALLHTLSWVSDSFQKLDTFHGGSRRESAQFYSLESEVDMTSFRQGMTTAQNVLDKCMEFYLRRESLLSYRYMVSSFF